MASIIRKYPDNLDAKETYMLLKGPNNIKMSDAKNKVLTVNQFVLFEDTNMGTGETTKVLSVKSNDGIYATNSASFIREFEFIVESFGDNIPPVKVIAGKSSKGRPYLTCVIEM